MKDTARCHLQDLAMKHDTVAVADVADTIIAWIDQLHLEGYAISEDQFIAVCRYEGWKRKVQKEKADAVQPAVYMPSDMI